MKWYLIMILIRIFLMLNSVKNLFMSLLTIIITFYRNVYSNLFSHFFFTLVICSFIVELGALYVFWRQVLYQIHNFQYFLSIYMLSTHFLDGVVFSMKVFNFDIVQHVFCFCHCTFSIICKKQVLIVFISCLTLRL